MQVVRERNIDWVVARVWHANDARSAKIIERKLKKQKKNGKKLCPICRVK